MLKCRSAQFFFLLLVNLLPVWAFGKGGKTANGCTYDIINGKYFYNCPKLAENQPVVENDVSRADIPLKNAPVASAAPAPIISAPPPAPYAPGPTVISPSLPKDSENIPVLHAQSPNAERGSENPGEERDYPESHFGKMVYAGGSLGTTNFIKTDNLKGPVTAYGIQLGTNVSDFIGIELGYSYASTDLNLGLEQRAGGVVVTPLTRAQLAGVAPPVAPPSTVDSTLTAHIINAEAQLHLTRAESAFRPFLGLGLAYKIAGLKENFPNGTTGISDSSVMQNALGGTAAIGAKYRASKSIQFAGAFRFFVPIATSNPQWNTPPGSPQQQLTSPIVSPNVDAPPGSAQAPVAQNLFQGPDTRLTSAPLSQLVATVQYIF